jgi:uncharacterized protein YdeI (YjbR/CyaY-like superfamily)
MTTDSRVDAYIESAAPFAQPILVEMRAMVHAALPDADETIKWGFPHFTVKGKNIAGMAAFKAHCGLVVHGDGRQADKSAEALGQHGKIAALSDLPSRADLAAKLVAARDRILTRGTALKPAAARKPRPEIPVPEDFAAALDASPAARASFDGFAPSHRREYLEWITEAKSEATRGKRLAQALEWLAEGKKRNWKYEKC